MSDAQLDVCPESVRQWSPATTNTAKGSTGAIMPWVLIRAVLLLEAYAQMATDYHLPSTRAYTFAYNSPNLAGSTHVGLG